MNMIDQAIKLPEKTAPLRRYARFYAFRPDGTIAMLFDANTRFEGKRPKDYGCSELMPDDTLKDVPCSPDTRPRAGERRWVNYDQLPRIADGGCSVIHAVFDPKTKSVQGVRCNGEG